SASIPVMLPNWYSGSPSATPILSSSTTVHASPGRHMPTAGFSTIVMPALSRTVPAHSAELGAPPHAARAVAARADRIKVVGRSIGYTHFLEGRRRPPALRTPVTRPGSARKCYRFGLTPRNDAAVPPRADARPHRSIRNGPGAWFLRPPHRARRPFASAPERPILEGFSESTPAPPPSWAAVAALYGAHERVRDPTALPRLLRPPRPPRRAELEPRPRG